MIDMKAANKRSSILTDFALEHVKSNQEKSQLCVVQPTDYTKYVVKDNKGKLWTVDLELRTCTCRKFDLDMLPCAHAIVVCRHTRVPKERLYSDYFTTQWLQTAYAPSIHPVPHPSSCVLPEHGLKQEYVPIVENLEKIALLVLSLVKHIQLANQVHHQLAKNLHSVDNVHAEDAGCLDIIFKHAQTWKQNHETFIL
ncbi:hypothetical protein Ddye_012866 [Dipteronia dyeriana]|uniref:SWIM-type domain-containing protein n=1 Tax=Dipteronia dyeriana TaxID=168575 RepID=A0AAD9X526_9ROSI|nr:hypothetical protein Ddye_012866 [Dipteronia dyeriana]